MLLFCLDTIYISVRPSSLLRLSRNLTIQKQYRHLCSQNPKRDNSDGVLVYSGTLAPQIRSVKVLTLITSLSGIIAQPIIYKHCSQVGSIAAIVAVYSFLGFFTVLSPFLIHSFTRKYVTHIYFNARTQEYTATVYTLFLRKKKIMFTPDDVKVPEIPGMFTSFYVKGIPVFVDPRLFEDPGHYAKIMGFDKPLDLKIGNNDPPNDAREGMK